jgi:hypothetical protein
MTAAPWFVVGVLTAMVASASGRAVVWFLEWRRAVRFHRELAERSLVNGVEAVEFLERWVDGLSFLRDESGEVYSVQFFLRERAGVRRNNMVTLQGPTLRAVETLRKSFPMGTEEET